MNLKLSSVVFFILSFFLINPGTTFAKESLVDESTRGESSSEKGQDYVEITFLCMQLASISKKDIEFSRLLGVGVIRSEFGINEFIKLYENNAPGIPADIREIFGILKNHNHDLRSFVLSSHIIESSLIVKNFIKSNDPKERIVEATDAFSRLSCASIN